MAEIVTPSTAAFPSVDFAFDDLKAKMNLFTIRFDKWTQNKREQVLRERNEFAKAIGESRGTRLYQILSCSLFSETQKDLNKQIEAHKARQSEIAQGILLYNWTLF